MDAAVEALRSLLQTYDNGTANEPNISSPSAFASYLHQLARTLEKSGDVCPVPASASVVVKDSLRGVKPKKKPRNKGGRAFDITRYLSRHIALEVIYVGWKYHGFALQKDTSETVEEYLFEALRRTRLIGAESDRWEDCGYSRCGRTDKGVSAFGQVVAIKLRSNAPADATEPPTDEHEVDYISTINKALPPEIRVRGWCPVPERFTARFSATFRHYKYFFHLDQGMDLEAMQLAASMLVGEHDFRNFCKMDALNVQSFTRRIVSAVISAVPWACGASVQMPMYVFDVRGSAFLYHQVRCIVAVLFMVARGQEPPDVVKHMLDLTRFPRKPIYKMAAEEPLVLFKCGFDESLQWRRGEPLGRWTLFNHIAKLRSQSALRTASLQLAAEECLASAKAGCFAAQDGHTMECDLMVSNWSVTLDPRSSRSSGVISESEEPRHRDGFLDITKSSTHVPLANRPTEDTYEERIKRIRSKTSIRVNIS